MRAARPVCVEAAEGRPVLRLVIVLPLAPLLTGAGFALARWPLHLTVAPTFVVDTDLESVVAAVGPAIASAPRMTLSVGQDEGFGRSHRIPVSLVAPSTALTALHHRLIDVLSADGAEFDDPDFIGSNYRPHVTMTKAERANPGAVLDLGQAAIVDMAPIGPDRLRRVVWAASLTGSQE